MTPEQARLLDWAREDARAAQEFIEAAEEFLGGTESDDEETP